MLKFRPKRGYAILLAVLLFLLSGCGEEEKAPELLEENACSLADGQQVSVWRYPGDSKALYRLEDGTFLLAVDQKEALDDVDTEYTAALEALSDAAKETVSAACTAELPELPIAQYLEEAYAQYTLDGEKFQCALLSRELFPSGASEGVLYITVQTSLPQQSGEEQTETLTWTFDRETGEKIDGWSLFCVPEAEAKEALFGAYSAEDGIKDQALAAFRPEYVRFYPDHYEISYTLPESGITVALSGEYTQEVRAVLHSWAIPTEAA